MSGQQSAHRSHTLWLSRVGLIGRAACIRMAGWLSCRRLAPSREIASRCRPGSTANHRRHQHHGFVEQIGGCPRPLKARWKISRLEGVAFAAKATDKTEENECSPSKQPVERRSRTRAPARSRGIEFNSASPLWAILIRVWAPVVPARSLCQHDRTTRRPTSLCSSQT